MINTQSKEAHMLFGKNHRAIMKLRNKGYGDAGFDIRTVPLYYNADKEYNLQRSKKYATYRTDTSEELGVHGERYRAVQPSKMIDTCRNILERSDLNLDGITEDIRTSHNGSRTFVRYTLPEVSYDTGDGDTASLGLLGITSFDSTWSFMISAAAIQQACLNLQVFTSGDVAIYKSRHTKGINLEAGARIITTALDMFENERERWLDWQQHKIRYEDIISYFANAINYKPLMSEFYSHKKHDEINELISKSKDMTYIVDKFRTIYKPKFGDTMWAVYNSLTDWATHAPAKKNIASVNFSRQERVRTYFNRIAA
jgi:hypothetical protein